jgi:DNA-binding NtrC family response regulator
MPKHAADVTAPGRSFGTPAPPEVPAVHVASVEHLIGHTLATVEREIILQTLRYHRGNRTYAANVLGISVRSLRNKIRAYGDQGENVPAPVSSRGGDPSRTWSPH